MIIERLSSIVKNSDWNWAAKATTEANVKLSNISSPSFIATFTVNLSILGFTKPLSRLPKGAAMAVVQAYREIELLKILLTISNDSTKEYVLTAKRAGMSQDRFNALLYCISTKTWALILNWL